jgi:hypothetical protein
MLGCGPLAAPCRLAVLRGINNTFLASCEPIPHDTRDVPAQKVGRFVGVDAADHRPDRDQDRRRDCDRGRAHIADDSEGYHCPIQPASTHRIHHLSVTGGALADHPGAAQDLPAIASAMSVLTEDSQH